jgi:hypothetical protein
MDNYISLAEFQSLPPEKIAKLVRAAGPKVCVFPINGTRRWFMLEYPEQIESDSVELFVELGARRMLEICESFFEHGIDTVLVPLFGPDIMERGDGYEPIGVQGLLWFAQNQKALDFYTSHDIRVRMYGDARRYFQNTPYACTLPAFEKLAQRTAEHQSHRLFLGVCAHDATEAVAEIGIRFYEKHGHLPNKRQIIEAYYGEFIEPVDFFIGFGQPTIFDMPLVATGNEDLYFTVAPSAYLDTDMLRAILYDHLYVRPADESDYAELSPKDWHQISDFYTVNRRAVLGLGHQYNGNHFWTPSPQVKSSSPGRYIATNPSLTVPPVVEIPSQNI